MYINIDGNKRSISKLSAGEAIACGFIMAIVSLVCIGIVAPLACLSFVLAGLVFGAGAIACVLVAIWASLCSLCFWRKKKKKNRLLPDDIQKIMDS